MRRPKQQPHQKGGENSLKYRSNRINRKDVIGTIDRLTCCV